MACGMLHLFGYQLPETHHRYLLATGFTDYWRRINIYWKDFMVRLFFNPVVFRLKRWPQPAALAAATAGGLPGHLGAARVPVVLAPRDLGILGARRPLLGRAGRAGPGQRPARRAAEPRPAAGAGSARRTRRPGGSRSAPLAIRGLKTAATFTTIAVLWSLWSSPSLSAWLDLMRRGILGALTRSRIAMATTQSTSVAAARIAMLQSVALLVVRALRALAPDWTGVRSVIASARSSGAEPGRARGPRGRLLRGADRRRRRARGGPRRAGAPLMGKPNGWVRFNDADVSRMLPGDFLQFELLPGIQRTLFGQPFVTNSHGMHSAEVALEKPPGTFRIAVLGASMDMGWGVTYQETYSHQLEEWLNEHAGRQGLGRTGDSRCSTSPSPPTARCSGWRRSAARRWRSTPTW